MPEASKDHPVLVHFRRKERNKAGIDVSVTYHPHGEDGWAGAKAVWTGVPGSVEARELLEHPDGPLIGEPVEPKRAVPPTTGKES